jgi:uncharacterized protein YjdB
MSVRLTLGSAIAVAMLLAACGGEGGGSNQQVGQFIDDPVGGLTYSCTSTSSAQSIVGITDTNGHFNYLTGQTCTFKVGNITLGALSNIPSDGKVTPQDVAGVARSATAAPSALAIAQFLQSLNDGSESGRIVIPAATTTALSSVAAVTLVSSSGAVSQSDLQTIVANVPGKTLVSPSTARSALEAQITSGMVATSSGAISSSAPVVLNSITVSAAASSKAAGLTEQMIATGYYSDGSSKDITNLASWSSSDTSTATVSTSGLAQGLKKGSATITANLTPAGSTTAVRGSLIQTTTDAVLQSIAITNSANPPAGLTDQLTATGIYSDGTTKNLTTSVTWTSSNSSTLTVDASTGLVTGVAKGSALVTARDEISEISGNYTETVVDPTLTNIVISYVESGLTTIKQGANIALKAIATFSNNTVQTVSSLVNWLITPANNSDGAGSVAVAINGALDAILTATKIGDISLSSNYLNKFSNSLSLSVAPVSISGTVAMGAPMAFGAVEIYDARGQLAGIAVTNASGVYSLSNIDMTRFTAPFTIKAVGQVGDSTTTLVSVSTGGIANVNQLTNAIAANLSTNGNPTSLTSGNSLTSTSISNAVSAYASALSNVISTMNATTNLIGGTFNSSYDALLDNVTAQVLPSGQVALATSEGQALTDLLGATTNGVVASTSLNSTQITAGQLPTASAASSLPAPTAALSAASLEMLRTQLNTCFAQAAASRATQSTVSPSSSPSWSALSTVCSDLATSDFKHNGYYWLDSTSGCSSNNAYCLGMFGYMLTNSTYDSIQFVTPTHIRPIAINKWYVKFPVKYSDGSIAQFGDAAVANYMVVTYNTMDGKYRFSGNQRDVPSYAEPVVQKIKNINTNAVRYETGLNLFVSAYNSRSLSTIGSKKYVTQAVVKGRGLPASGITFANKVNRNPATYPAVGVGSNTASTYNVCGGVLNVEFPSVIPSSGPYLSTTPNAAGCAGVIRLNYVDEPTGSYPMLAGVPSSLANWSSSAWLDDTGLNSIKNGEPYTFELTLNDGSVITYVNRISYPMMDTASVKLVKYPNITNTDFAAFNGSLAGNTTYTASWDQLDTSQVFSAALYWSKGVSSMSNNKLPVGVRSQVLNCTNTGSPACQTASSWISTGASPDSGILQVRSRTFDGLQIFSQLRQY